MSAQAWQTRSEHARAAYRSFRTEITAVSSSAAMARGTVTRSGRDLTLDTRRGAIGAIRGLGLIMEKVAI